MDKLIQFEASDVKTFNLIEHFISKKNCMVQEIKMKIAQKKLKKKVKNHPLWRRVSNVNFVCIFGLRWYRLLINKMPLLSKSIAFHRTHSADWIRDLLSASYRGKRTSYHENIHFTNDLNTTMSAKVKYYEMLPPQ